MQLFWAPLAELIEARKNKKGFQPAEQAPAASNVTGLTQALQASPGAAKKLRAGRTAAKNWWEGSSVVSAARCSLAPDGARIRPRR